MPKVYAFMLIIFSILKSIVLANDQNNCKWDNLESPCLEINTNLPNSSKLSKNGVNKIVINKKKIVESGASDLVDLMKLVSEINITQSGPAGQQASIFMRGTGSNHTLVMINGVPINDQSTTQGLHDFGVDFIQTVQQIEIYPGSSAAHFGSNAIGGAINIVLTGDLKDHYSFSSTKDNNYEFAANKTYIYDNSFLNFKFGHVNTQTVSAKGHPEDERDKVKNYTLNLNFENYIDNTKRIFFNNYLRRTLSEYDNSDINQIGYEGDNRMSSYQFGYENNEGSKKENYLIYLNKYNREYDERGIIDTYKSDAVGLKYDVSKTLNNNLSLGYGSDYRYDHGEFENNGSYEASTKGHTDNLSIYGNLGINILSNSNLSIFARNDNHKQTGNNLTYKLNYNQKINNFNFGASYMNGLRNPTLYELFGTDNFGYSGNRNLQPEKSNTYEIYSNYNFNKKIKFSLRGFRSNIKNNIEYVSNKYINDSDNVDLNQSGVNSKLSIINSNTQLDLHSSFLSSKKENGFSQLRRPEKNYGLNFTRKMNHRILGEFNLNLSYHHYGKHYDTHSTSFNTIIMDSTDLVDININKTINKSVIFLKVSNLFNEKFQRPHGYNQDQRILKFGVNY